MRPAVYDPGEMDQKITIQRETLTSDGMGGQEVTVTDLLVDEWAAVRPLSGREFERYDAMQATAMVRFTIRFREGIRHNDRIIWQGTAHNIRYIPPASTREMYLVMEAERGVAL